MNSSYNIYSMDIQTLLYHFDRRMTQLIKEDAKRHEMDQEPHWIMTKIEEDIMPHVEYINNWEPSDDDLGGEPPLTLSEMHEAARARKLEAWK